MDMTVYYPNFPIPKQLDARKLVCGWYVVDALDRDRKVSGPYDHTEQLDNAMRVLSDKRDAG